MKNKYFLLALAFLCILVGQNGYAQDWQDMGFDTEISGTLQQFENAGVEIKAYTDTQTFIDAVNSDSYASNDILDYNGDGVVNTVDMATMIAISDAELNATLALTNQLREVVVFNNYHDPTPFLYYNLDFTNTQVQDDYCFYYPLYCSLILPIQNAFTITDSSNPNRIVNNGQALVMVNSGQAREASINMTTSAGCAETLVWTGSGVTGNGYSATYSGTSTTLVGVSCPSSGNLAAGNIQIVDEDKTTFSQSIDFGKLDKLINIEGVSTLIDFEASISAESRNIEIKNSPNIGIYREATGSIKLGSLSKDLLSYKITKPVYGLLSVVLELKASVAATGNITYIRDESTGINNLSGYAEAGVTGSLTVGGQVGYEPVCALTASGGGEFKIAYKAGVEVEDKTLYLAPGTLSYEATPIVKVEFGVLDNAISCKIYEHKFPGYSCADTNSCPSFDRFPIYTFNK